MVRKARTKSTSGIYHVMYRGVNRQEIFHDNEDNRKFLEILKKYKEKLGLEFYAWCLMNNHVHLLLQEGEEELGATMKRIGVSYALYYNFHQNPVKAGMVAKVNEWNWSSCAGYYGQHYFPGELLDRDRLLSLFSDDVAIAVEQFREFNEQTNQDECLDDFPFKRRRLSDEEAKVKMKRILGATEISNVKNLPKFERELILREIKGIDGLSKRQAARILGIPPSLVFKV